MAELGAGSGSGYPGALDTNATVEVDSPASGKTKARADVPNDLAASIIAVQTELGTDPAGTLTDVKSFLQTEHDTDGTHSSVTLSGELIQKVGSDVASASDLDVTGAGNIFDVTGTTTINSIQSKGVGTVIVLQFDGAVTLTHSSANLNLGADASNLTTTAGDVYTFYEYASADWRLVSGPTATLPSGVIVIWSGAITAIPTGWVICDGNNSTPDLTARFVIHASADSGATYDVGDTGGSTTSGGHTLVTSEMPAHTHTYDKDTPILVADPGSGTTRPSISSDATGSTGGGGSHTHTGTIPPYYALAYIMKT